MSGASSIGRVLVFQTKGYRFETDAPLIVLQCVVGRAAITSDCKSDAFGLRWFESITMHHYKADIAQR